MNVLGVDINTEAIARATMLPQPTDGSLSFRVLDAVTELSSEGQAFDVVVLIRVLTCLPDKHDWGTTLARIKNCLKPMGLLYVHDFLFSPEIGTYRSRYEAGALRGYGKGTFDVFDRGGRLQFTAHHHTEDEVRAITSQYTVVTFREHESESMNGNPCRMFEFIGQKS